MKKFAEGITRTLEYVTGKVKTWAERWKKNIPFSSFTSRKQNNDEFTGQVVLGYGETLRNLNWPIFLQRRPGVKALERKR